ncbi:MAG: alcohol dehydrogenase [Comamonadaceae bacterium]|nr:MAG: alcohol dehydrogenase [Comamonadaceae bacterium]
MTNRAAVLTEPKNLEIRDLATPDPEAGGLSVELVLGGVCGSDLHLYTGQAGALPFPIILGHEGVGRIAKLGAGVTTDYASVPVAEGDLVYWSPIALCNSCYSCTVLEQTPCENSSFFEHADKPNWGTYQERVWLPARQPFYKLPAGADPVALAALGCALPTALKGFDQVRPVRMGDTVVIQGAGPVGLAAAMLASVSGASDIVVIDSSPSRLEFARRMGATATLSLTDTTAEQRRDQIYALSGPAGPQIVFEAAGALPAFSEGSDLTGVNGMYIVMGLWGPVGKSDVQPGDISLRNKAIGGATFPKAKHYYQAVQLSAKLQSRFPIAELVTHRFSIADSLAALHAVENGEAVKAVIDPTL